MKYIITSHEFQKGRILFNINDSSRLKNENDKIEINILDSEKFFIDLPEFRNELIPYLEKIQEEFYEHHSFSVINSGENRIPNLANSSSVEYIVHGIVRCHATAVGFKYEVDWGEMYGEEQFTWESAENLLNCRIFERFLKNGFDEARRILFDTVISKEEVVDTSRDENIESQSESGDDDDVAVENSDSQIETSDSQVGVSDEGSDTQFEASDSEMDQDGFIENTHYNMQHEVDSQIGTSDEESDSEFETSDSEMDQDGFDGYTHHNMQHEVDSQFETTGEYSDSDEPEEKMDQDEPSTTPAQGIVLINLDSQEEVRAENIIIPETCDAATQTTPIQHFEDIDPSSYLAFPFDEPGIVVTEIVSDTQITLPEPMDIDDQDLLDLDLAYTSLVDFTTSVFNNNLFDEYVDEFPDDPRLFSDLINWGLDELDEVLSML